MSKTLLAYQTDPDGWFVGVVQADESPLEPGVFHLPGGSTLLPPPPTSNGLSARLVAGVWTLETRPVVEDPTSPPDGPPGRRTVSALTFLERFQPEERIAIRAAARVSEGLEDWLDLLRAAQEVDLDDPRVFAGLNALVNAGVLRFDRVPELLA